MKKFVFPAIASVMAATNAFAADLPRKALAPVAPVVLPTFTWTGFYLGVNAGAAFGDDVAKTSTLDSDLVSNASLRAVGIDKVKYKSNGFIGGGQIGYNYQMAPGGGLVVGVEADFDYAGLKRSRNWSKDFNDVYTTGSLAQHVDVTTRDSLDFLGTVRGRLGYAFDRVLVYGTGGLAYGSVDYRHNLTVDNNYFPTNSTPFSEVLRYSAHKSATQTGFAYGGGIEYAIPADSALNLLHSNAVTLKAEYIRYDLGSRNVIQYDSTGKNPMTSTKVKSEGDVVRAGLNFKFGL